jgi:hypothetical protein
MNKSTAAQLLEMANNDPNACLDIVIPMLNEQSQESPDPLLSYFAGTSYMNAVISVITGEEKCESEEEFEDTGVKLSMAALTHLRDAGDLSVELNDLFKTEEQLALRIDMMCVFIEKYEPGSSSGIWHTIKLRYLGERVYFHPKKEKEVNELLDVPFPCSKIVRSALAVGLGEDKMSVGLSDIENYWSIDADERMDHNFLGSITFSKEENGKWVYESSHYKDSDN